MRRSSASVSSARSPGPGISTGVLLSQDNCLRVHLRAYGGSGYSYLLRTFIPTLEAEGFTAADVHQLIVDNPRRALTGGD